MMKSLKVNRLAILCMVACMLAFVCAFVPHIAYGDESAPTTGQAEQAEQQELAVGSEGTGKAEQPPKIDIPETATDKPLEEPAGEPEQPTFKEPSEGEVAQDGQGKADAPVEQSEGEGEVSTVTTVDIHYGDKTYKFPVLETRKLSEIMKELGIPATVSDVERVEFSNPNLIDITKDGNDWIIRGTSPFDTHEEMALIFKKVEQPIVLPVTDAPDGVKETFRGRCYIGATWMEGSQSYFEITDFTGDAKDGRVRGRWSCQDPGAAAPSNVWADYVATYRDCSFADGWTEYWIYITPPGAWDGSSYANGLPAGYQHVGGYMRIPHRYYVDVNIVKSSSNPGMTNGNPNFTLAGAVYWVYADRACTTRVATDGKYLELRTDANGRTNTVKIFQPSTVFIKEVTAPRGFKLNPEVIQIDNRATLPVRTLYTTDDPVGSFVSLRKSSTNPNITNGNGFYSLAGAVYYLYTNAACSVRAVDVYGNYVQLVTDTYGNTPSAVVNGGAYWFREISAPRGFVLDPTPIYVYVAPGGSATAYASDRPYSDVTLRKVSAAPNITDGNPNYSLAGAIYYVYRDAGCTVRATDIYGNLIQLVTDVNGNTNAVRVVAGSYWLKEFQAPKGYELADQAIGVNAVGNAVVTAQEQPHSDPMPMIKVDEELYDPETWTRENNKAQGAATLEGAEFTVRYYMEHYDTIEEALAATHAREWIFRTNEQGYANISDEYYVSGDKLYYKIGGTEATLPIGTILVWESKAPLGYVLPNPREYHLTWVEMGSSAAFFICKDRVLREEVIINKVDRDIQIPVDNTEFSMWMLDPTLTVVKEDGTCAPAEGVDLSDDEVWIFIAKAVTGADGKVSFGTQPIAYYKVLETRPNPAYASHTETIDGYESGKVYPVYFSVDFASGKIEQSFANTKIQIECNVRIRTIQITSIGHKYIGPKGKPISNIGKEEYLYYVDFDNGKTNVYADEYWLINNCEMIGAPHDLRITRIWMPVVKGDVDGKVWILVQTNKTTTGTAAGMQFHQPHLNKNAMSNAQRFDPTGWDIFGAGEYSALERVLLRVADYLGVDEYILRIALIYGAVTPGFTTEGGLPLAYSVVATHELPAGTVLNNSATSHITRNWYAEGAGEFTPMSEGEGVAASSANGLADNSDAAVETRVIETFEINFTPSYRQWVSGWRSLGPGWYKTGENGHTWPYAPVAGLCALVCGVVAGAICGRSRRREER